MVDSSDPVLHALWSAYSQTTNTILALKSARKLKLGLSNLALTVEKQLIRYKYLICKNLKERWVHRASIKRPFARFANNCRDIYVCTKAAQWQRRAELGSSAGAKNEVNIIRYRQIN